MSDKTGNGGVETTTEGSVVVAHIDDGKANAITHEMIESLQAALDQAEQDDRVGAVVIVGRPGKFSAGFDLNVMQASVESARDLLQAGGQLGLRFYLFPKPVVLGCTGHALAMGSILLMTADWRIGAEGPFKIGMNEVAIGMPVPRFAVEIARDRLSKRHFVPATGHAHIYDPSGAVEAGYLDRVVAPDEVEDAAIAHGQHLADTLQRGAFRVTRNNMRAALGKELQRGMDEDMKLFDVGS